MRPRIPYDMGLFSVVLALIGFGLVMVFSSSTVISKEMYGSHLSLFTRQLIAVGLGLTVLLASMRIDYHVFGNRKLIGALIFLTIALLSLTFFFPATNGAHRWISLGPANFQPSELAKLSVVLFTAYFIVSLPEKMTSLRRELLPYGVVVGVIVGLILLEPDLGTAVMVVVIAALLLFLGGFPLRYYFGSLAVAVPLFYFLVLRVPFRRSRILAFLDPAEDPLGAGYQIRQSLISVGSGGWSGLGFAEGKQKLHFLPEPHTDFIFAVVGEELGLIGCGALLLLFLLFFWRGVRVALRADSRLGTFIGLGIVAMVICQAFINMSVVVSLLPTKGIPLPFISLGGSSMLVILAAIGVLLNISRHARNADSGERW